MALSLVGNRQKQHEKIKERSGSSRGKSKARKAALQIALLLLGLPRACRSQTLGLAPGPCGNIIRRVQHQLQHERVHALNI